MDLQSFFKMSYGLYVVSSKADGKLGGCIVNTLSQVTAEPVRLSVAINKENYTTELIRKSGCFTGAVLGKDAPLSLIGQFGFHSGREIAKFDNVSYKEDAQGCPYPTDHMVAYYSCKVEQEVDLGTHVLFVGQALEAEALSAEEPMTYAYYHTVKKGTTPKNAPSYKGDAALAENAGESWRCTVCGYIHEGPLPDGFVCPICGVGPESFEKKGGEAPAGDAKESWRCTVCGYIHEGPLPDGFICPICGVGPESFEKN